MSDEPTDVAQPEQGQGDGGTGAPPYAEFLTRFPEEARGTAEEVFRDWDAQTTRRFQEHSEYRKAWEPYEQIGVNRYDPEAVQWALSFREAAEQNPQAVQEWFQDYAKQHGLTPAEAAQELQQQQQPVMDDLGLYDPQQLEKLLEQKLGPVQQQLQQFQQWREQQEFAARKQEADRYIEGQIAELQQKHGDEFNRDAVESFVRKYIESDPLNAVPRAWAEYQNLVNQIQKRTLQQKVDAPPPAESGGSAHGGAEPIRTLEEAGRIAREQLRQQRLA